MAFVDPQSITIATVLISLPRTGFGLGTGTFSAADSTASLRVQHSIGKRTRRVARFDHSKIAPDPLISSTNIKHSMGVWLVVDVPPTGYTVSEQKGVVDGFLAAVAAGAGASNFTTKFLGGES